jgi:hypothetical protein
MDYDGVADLGADDGAHDTQPVGLRRRGFEIGFILNETRHGKAVAVGPRLRNVAGRGIGAVDQIFAGGGEIPDTVLGCNLIVTGLRLAGIATIIARGSKTPNTAYLFFAYPPGMMGNCNQIGN